VHSTISAKHRWLSGDTGGSRMPQTIEVREIEVPAVKCPPSASISGAGAFQNGGPAQSHQHESYVLIKTGHATSLSVLSIVKLARHEPLRPIALLLASPFSRKPSPSNPPRRLKQQDRSARPAGLRSPTLRTDPPGAARTQPDRARLGEYPPLGRLRPTLPPAPDAANERWRLPSD
jgi:hypothetical protein